MDAVQVGSTTLAPGALTMTDNFSADGPCFDIEADLSYPTM